MQNAECRMQSGTGDEFSSRDSFFPTASLEYLHARAKIVRRVREFFDSRGFLEVETPILSRDTVVDRYLEPFSVDGSRERNEVKRPDHTAVGDNTFYLQTSPEFAMKRILAAGAKAIYQIGRVFRRGDFGQMHNPEFTMLEWYRTGDDYAAGVAFLSDLAETILARGKAGVVTLRQLFAEHVQLTMAAGNEAQRSDRIECGERRSRRDRPTLRSRLPLNPHIADCRQLRDYALQSGIAFPESFSVAEHGRENWVDLIFAERLQASLGVQRSEIRDQSKSGEQCLEFGVKNHSALCTLHSALGNPIIVIDYLASQSQLAKTRRIIDADGEFDVSERFELFVDGLELANGYHELLDADILLERIRATNALRIADGNAPLPEESRLLDAMRHGLPPCCGCAMGLDRLVMAALQTRNISDVIAFPWDRA